MSKVDALKIKIFADGADLNSIVTLSKDPLIQGFTTNPTLMRKDGVTDYEAFAGKLLKAVTDKPISFEVFSDELDEIEAQARAIASWGKNVYVKIPVTNTKGQSTSALISKLSQDGIALNVTAILTLQQVQEVVDALAIHTPAIVSVFAGRIADTSVDPIPVMSECLKIMKSKPKAELLWASPRELLNIFQADACGCHIITVAHDMLKKLSLVGKDLNQYSLETVKMFYDDALASNFKINTNEVAVAEI